MKLASTTKLTLQFFWQHVWQYPWYTLGIIVFVPITVLVNNFLPPIIIAHVLNRLSLHQYTPHDVWGSFGPSLVAYALLEIFGAVILWRLVDVLVWHLEANVERNIGRQIYNHLIKQSANFHANHFSGSLVSQTNKLMSAYIRFADTTIFQVMPMLAGLLWASLIIAFRLPLYSVVLLIFSIFYIASSFFATRNVRKLSALHASAESRQTGYLADSVTNVMAIKSFAGNKFEDSEFVKITNKTRRRHLDLAFGSQKQMLYFTSITSVIAAFSLVIAVVGVVNFGANIGTVFLILSYTATILSQLFTFSTNSLRNYNRSFGDASDMIEILQIEPEVKDTTNPVEPEIKKGAIEFKKVDFTHDEANDALFRDLNISIKPGEKIGLVGHSGSGKTTFTRLLLRFSDIDHGEILIDGQNISEISQDNLRLAIAYVPQDPIMFHRTLLENIRYGKQDATEAEIFNASKVAHAHEFIKDLPKKYDTLVGERGVKLSGGQRQRVAIARAMIKDAPILVLDEATSALDSESEKLIQDALWKLMEGRTAIVIAHRLSTIQKMDRIVVMEDGKIVEQGTHKELIGQKGIYAELWAHQSGGFLED